MSERDLGKCGCGEKFEREDFSSSCGAYVCYQCGNHKGLAKCYCGWSASGGDGYRQLIEDGETIEGDDA
jgi:hypothetical protein